MNAFLSRLVILSREERAAWLHAIEARKGLIVAGHSALKAHQIVLDCKRGDRYSLAWVLSALAIPFDAEEKVGS